ncbi:ferrous iron transport protein B [Allorhodopirellula solitaria]|uniref:Ferrous iron transport protein B n=1 Tax=Allorhodopirellula solitaria TaxID=2527987 RepID=A0A5C5YI53_9BACT|nr:ferrous iron transport protein B [Allorhodopirellula solitaria]TWT74372.1 Ferrous iron transport protein B [Allorhodopirellula solitaria]
MSTSVEAAESQSGGASKAPQTGESVVAMLGNPNVGKTSIFNRLTNLLAKTSNFPGTTIDRRIGRVEIAAGQTVTLVDLPGMYSFEPSSPEEQVAHDFVAGQSDLVPDAVLLIVDATNLQRTLFLVREALQQGRPTMVAVNMIEAARRRGIEIDLTTLSRKLGCPVVGVSARTGEGFDRLKSQLGVLLSGPALPMLIESGSPECPPQPAENVLAVVSTDDESSCGSCRVCPYADGHQWASSLARESIRDGSVVSDETADRVDRFLTHRWFGMAVFAAVMVVAFSLVFWIAQVPMQWLDEGFAALGAAVSDWLPEGDFQSLVVDGIIGGVGGVVVFLPQILILFFMLALLEDSGYLSRAVVVVDRWMRRVGLPGQAFVPLLAAHACAIPAIMATKVIESRRDRLAAIMVIPLMTCSARLPVYTMLAAMLFPQNPLFAAGLFAGAYVLGMVAAFVVAFVLKLTLLPGQPSPLILDLPHYRAPSIRNAMRYSYERGWMFLRDAGTVILLISIGIWALSTYPKLSDEQFAADLEAKSVAAEQISEPEMENVRAAADQEHAIIGRLGHAVAPVFEPLGFDWKTSVGVMTSFAAREVVVSTLSILYGLGPEPEEGSTLQDRLTAATYPNGQKVFTPATCVSLLVFFVLAMQCLPTQAVTKKETGSWKWAAFQFGYMTVLAYAAAFVAYRTVLMLT